MHPAVTGAPRSLTRKPEVLSSRQRTRQMKQRVRKAEYSVGPVAPSWALRSLPRTASSPAGVGAGSGESQEGSDQEKPKNTLISKGIQITASCRPVTRRPGSTARTSPVLLPIPMTTQRQLR